MRHVTSRQPEGCGAVRLTGTCPLVRRWALASGQGESLRCPQRLVVQSHAASCKECGTTQKEGTIQLEVLQLEDNPVRGGAWNRVGFQPAGAEGIGGCEPGPWAAAVMFLKPDNPGRESGFGLEVTRTCGTAKGQRPRECRKQSERGWGLPPWGAS